MTSQTGAPKCRVCEHNHWSHEPHVFAASSQGKSGGGKQRAKQGATARVGRAGLVREEAKPKPSPESDSATESQAQSQVARNRVWREKNPSAYREYMREYMRKRRK